MGQNGQNFFKIKCYYIQASHFVGPVARKNPSGLFFVGALMEW
jgi:hypothetical protein